MLIGMTSADLESRFESRLEFAKNPRWLPLSIRNKYGINTDEIRIDSVFIPY